jgi:hypothetical protein
LAAVENLLQPHAEVSEAVTIKQRLGTPLGEARSSQKPLISARIL